MGVATAVVVGVVILVAYYKFKSAFFKGSHELVFEAAIMLTACVMITAVAWAMLRMLSMYQKWEHRMAERLGVTGFDRYALFLMAYTATIREGLEAVIFITGVSQGNPTSIPIPGLLGLMLGSIFSYVVFFGSRKFDLSYFMYLTSAFLFAVAAGLLSRGFYMLQAAGFFGTFDLALPRDYAYSADAYTPDVVPVTPSWVNVYLGDLRDCCSASKNSATFFGLMRSLFGYSDHPTRLEIITYVVYWGYAITVGLYKWRSGSLYGKSPQKLVGGGLAGEDDDAHSDETQELADCEGADTDAAKREASIDAPSSEADDHVAGKGAPSAGLEVSPSTAALIAEHAGSGEDAPVQPLHLSRREDALRRLRLAADTVLRAGRSRYAPVATFGVIALGLILGLPLGLELHPPPPGPPVVQLQFTIARMDAAPQDGWPAITVNGQYPGPVIRVPLGATVKATIVNAHPSTSGQGTGIHWHGQRLPGTPFADGVPGVTQCPVPAVAGANSMIVSFTADRPGTFWYHGHMDGQYPDGLYGAFIVDDGGAALAAAGAPQTGPIQWIWMVADRYRTPVCYPSCGGAAYPNIGLNGTLLGWFLSPESQGVEPVPDAVVLNGALSGTLSFSASRIGPRQLVRIINAAALSPYNFSVDGLPLTVVELDGTAVQPFDVPWLLVDIAQRAVVVLDWSRLHPAVASSPALTVRAVALGMVGGPANSTASTLGLGSGPVTLFNKQWTGTIAFAPGAVPSYVAPPGPTVPAPADLNLLAARSWPPEAARNATQVVDMTFGFAYDEVGVNRGYINNATHRPVAAAMVAPVLHSFMANQPLSAATNLTGGRAIIGDAVNPFVLPFNRVVELLVTNLDAAMHPFHLHGHNFWIVATSEVPDGETRYGPNYVRRDVVSMPPYGWARIRFVADNPGVWLFHCHIDWHMHVGLVAVVVEAPAQIYKRAQTGAMSLPASQAAACRTWVNGATIPGAGSGFVTPAAVKVGDESR